MDKRTLWKCVHRESTYTYILEVTSFGTEWTTLDPWPPLSVHIDSCPLVLAGPFHPFLTSGSLLAALDQEEENRGE
jgi:hypothetical protein